ncbi:hypothetical protein BB453_01090 [Helicobacter pylori]|uniref:Uncharacterized protein n=1 Tax=Helicobacter pylori TaxID=210 RepID=A0AB73R245_HELPX|nr:hypothetical protein BB451_00510 [Helicobacter pylori]PDW34335.1 hypothetical protein BB453_01090 [Helicobacter pylori]
MLEICYKNDFLKEIERFCNHFPQKLKGLLVKVGLSLSFGAFACGYLKITACLVRDPHSFKRVSHSFKKALSVS